MRNVAVLVGVVAVAVFATAALTGNAGVKQTSAVSLQKQVNELRSELICLEAATGDGLAQDAYLASSATGSPKTDYPVDERGVCKQVGVKPLPGMSPDGVLTQPFRQLIVRAFGH